MVRDQNFKTISEKFLLAARNSLSKSDEVEFTVASGFDTDVWQPFVSVELENDEEKTFMFTDEQARRFISNLAFSLQFTTDATYHDFARLMIKNFSEAVAAIKDLSDGDVIGLVVRKKDKK